MASEASIASAGTAPASAAGPAGTGPAGTGPANTGPASAAEKPGAQSKGAQTRRAILDAAIARFGREGFRATSVADIARDAAISGTLAYAYFPNKEALFLAAVDEDAAALIQEALVHALEEHNIHDWPQTLIFTLLHAVQQHPLAKRLLAGLEPGVTDRVLEIPALAELRKASAERIRSAQLHGTVRNDIDPVSMGNGVVAIMLSLLMSVVQFGGNMATSYGPDVAAVFEAAFARRPRRDPEENR
jgi:AcrR family transcriptional regulator